MTAVTITTTADVPVVNGSEDTWGTLNNAKWAAARVDLLALATTPANTIKGNNTGGSQGVDDLTPAQVTAMLPAVVGDTGSGGAKGLAPATVAGDKRKVLTGAGSYEAGYGRAFGCVITTTNVNGSQPTFTNGLNVASLSTITTSGGSQSQCTVTFTDALPNATYAVHGTVNGSISTSVAYGTKTTTSVIIYWSNDGGVNTEISVSGFA
jgi:hypothetical protein